MSDRIFQAKVEAYYRKLDWLLFAFSLATASACGLMLSLLFNC